MTTPNTPAEHAAAIAALADIEENHKDVNPYLLKVWVGVNTFVLPYTASEMYEMVKVCEKQAQEEREAEKAYQEKIAQRQMQEAAHRQNMEVREKEAAKNFLMGNVGKSFIYNEIVTPTSYSWQNEYGEEQGSIDIELGELREAAQKAGITIELELVYKIVRCVEENGQEDS